MGYHMILKTLISATLILGFAYIIYINALKEKKGNLKTIGQIITWALVILAIVIIVGGSYFGFTCKGKGMHQMKPGMQRCR
ncbi:hypothetical protein ACFL56_00235 [Candidatus Margulisiibacteriota bacterium]